MLISLYWPITASCNWYLCTYKVRKKNIATDFISFASRDKRRKQHRYLFKQQVSETGENSSLRQLHWLPVRQRVQYKLTLLVYKSLRGLIPLYLSEECQLATVGGRRELRSADVITCHVPRTQTKLGRWTKALEQSTAIYAIARHWTLVKRLLKTHLFV